MAITEIPKEKLMGEVVPALKRKLKDAEHNGIKPQKLKGVVQETAGLWPSNDLFNRIMWIVGYKSVGGLYYANGFGPEKPKKEKKQKKQPDQKVTNHDGQSITFEGDVVVTVKGAGHDFRSKAVKVIIFLSSVILLIVTNPLGLW